MKSCLNTTSFHLNRPYGYFKKKILYFFVFISFCTHVIAQQPTEEWIRRYNDTTVDFRSAYSIKSDALGFIYVLAEKNNDFGFLKYDQNGNLLVIASHWPTGFDNGGGNYFDVSPQGDVYITGNVNIGLNSWIYTVKYNSNGQFQWGKLYNLDNSDISNDIKVDNDGNLTVVGSSRIGSINFALLIKYNPNGDTMWTRTFNNGLNIAGANRFVFDNQSNIYVTGGIGNPRRCMILKYTLSGNLLWNKSFTFDSTRSNIGNGIAIDQIGNIYIAGTQVWFPFNNIHNYLIKMDNSGTLQWSRMLNIVCNGGYMNGPVVSLDGNSICYITEGANGTGGGGYSITTAKYNSVGDSQWVKMYSGGVPATANHVGNIKLDRLGNVYVCGRGHYPTTGDDFVTIKYTPSGVQQWVATYVGLINNGGDHAEDLIIDTNSNVYVTGGSASSNNPGVAVTIKYNQPVGIILGNSELPTQFKLYQNYPNPFNPLTKINYIVPNNTIVTLKIYNVLGRLVRTLVNEFKTAGNYSLTFDGSDIASGVYFYRIEAGDFVQSEKMVLVK